MFSKIHCARFRTAVLTTSIAGLLASGAGGASVVLRGNDPINTTSFNAAGTAPNGWDNDAAPSAENTYSTGAFQLRTPTGTGASTFQGASLSIDAGGSLLFKGSGVYGVNNLILNGGSIIQGDVGVAAPNNIGTLSGNITVVAPSSFDTTVNTNRVITINSAIHGPAGITILGTTGTVNFVNATNDFTGSLTLTGSSPLVVGALTNGGVAGAMGAASADASKLIFNGGRLRVNGGTASSTDRLFTLRTTGGTIDSANNAAAVSFTNTGAIVMEGTGARTLTFGGTGTAANTFAPLISDNGGPTSVTKIEAGNWELTAANTYTGATNINGGTLSFSNISNLGAGTALNLGGGNLRWVSGNVEDITLSRTVTLTAGTSGFNTNNQSFALTGIIGGAGGLAKLGGGTLTLSGVNTFAGGVTLNNSSGPLRITNSRAIGVGTKTITITGNVGGINVPSLVLAGESGPIVLPGSFSFTTSNDGLNTGGTPPALLNEIGDNVINGNFTLTSGGGGTRYRVDGGSLTLNGTITPISGQTRTAYFAGFNNGVANGALQNFSSTNVLSLVKDDSGTWVMNGANTYTGLTTVNGGTLIGNTASTGAGAVSVLSGANFGVRVSAPGQTFNTSDLTIGAGSSGLLFHLGPFGNPTAPVITTPSFNPGSGVTVSITGSNLSTGTAIPLIDYGTIGGDGFAALTPILPVRTVGTLVDNVADGRVDLLLTSFDYPRWTGATDGNWNTATQNWREVNSGNVTAYLEGVNGSDSVLFDDNATGTTNVNLTAALAPSNITVNNPTKDYTFAGSGKLSGITGLLKQGAGKLTIANTGGNDYAGTTTITAGTLQIGDGTTVGGGQFGVGPVVNDGVLVFNRPDDLQVSNIISGTGAVTKNGAGVVTLNSNNTYSGATTVSAGTLRLGSANALGATTVGTTVQSGATLDLNGVLVAAGETVTISGAGVGGNGAVINSSAGGQGFGLKNLVLAANASIGGSQRWDIRDVVGGLNAGGFALTKVGTNEIWLKDLGETQIGDLFLNGGLLGFEGNVSMGDPAKVITIGANGALGLFNNIAVNTRPIALQGGRIFAGAGAGNVLSGAVTISAPSTFEVATGATLSMSGLIGGTAGFTKIGPGILDLGGAGTNSVATDATVNGGTLRVSAENLFAPTASITINNGGTWTNTGNLLQTVTNFTVNTPTLQSINNLNLSGTLSILAGAHDINSGQSTTTNALNITGGANLRLGANNLDTFLTIGSGGLSLNDGTLQLGQLGGAVLAQVNLGGNVTSSGTSAILVPNALGSRAVDFLGANRTFNVTGGTLSVGASIQGGGLIKNGPGTLVLSGTSFYTEPTAINGGTLVVNGSISGSAVAVESGGTLGGDGSTGTVAVRGGGTLLSDSDLAPLNVGGLLFDPNSILAIEINGAASDAVTVGGQVTLAGTIGLSISILADAVDGLTYTLLNSTGGISGYNGGARFSYAGNILDEGERFTVTSGVFSQDFTISYAADSGNDVILAAVPEPGSAMLLVSSLALIGLRRSRRARR